MTHEVFLSRRQYSQTLLRFATRKKVWKGTESFVYFPVQVRARVCVCVCPVTKSVLNWNSWEPFCLGANYRQGNSLFPSSALLKTFAVNELPTLTGSTYGFCKVVLKMTPFLSCTCLSLGSPWQSRTPDADRRRCIYVCVRIKNNNVTCILYPLCLFVGLTFNSSVSLSGARLENQLERHGRELHGESDLPAWLPWLCLTHTHPLITYPWIGFLFFFFYFIFRVFL